MPWRVLSVVLMCSLLPVVGSEVTTAVPTQYDWQAQADEGQRPSIGLARSADRYREHLLPLHVDPTQAPASNDLTFATHDALLLTWGVKPSGGYQIAATAVTTDATTARVIIRCSVPKPGDMVTMALTNPAILVMVPKREQLEIRLTGTRVDDGVDFARGAGIDFTLIDSRVGLAAPGAGPDDNDGDSETKVEAPSAAPTEAGAAAQP